MRAGDFIPSELGQRLMPVILGVGPALRALHDAAERAWIAERKPGETERPDDWPASVRGSSEFADAVSLQDEVESLALELRDPDGNLVRTESIWLYDTRQADTNDPDPLDLDESVRHDLELLEFDDDLDPEDLDCFDDDELEMELGDTISDVTTPEPGRYQILITLGGVTKSFNRRYGAAG